LSHYNIIKSSHCQTMSAKTMSCSCLGSAHFQQKWFDRTGQTIRLLIS